MPSDKVTRILKAKSSFSQEQIAVMSDEEGWAWIYSQRSPPKEQLLQVCFTGFSVTEKEELIALAKRHRLAIAASVTRSLALLCVGENAGPEKLKKAKAQGVKLLTRSQFEDMLETGELAP